MSHVRVVIPAYNAQNYIAQCLESVISQSYQDWSLTVIDDGSSDATVSIAQHIADTEARIHVYSYDNGGVAVARNRGIERGIGEADYMLFLDNDDYLEPGAIATLVTALEQQPQATAAYGLPYFAVEGEERSPDVTLAFGYSRNKVTRRGLVPVPIEEPTTFATFVVWPAISTPGQVLIRSSVLKEVGGFDPATVPSDDWDMWIRLSRLGCFAFVPEIIINKRCHATNVSNNGKVMAVAEPIIRKKLATTSLNTREQRELARLGHLHSCFFKLTWTKIGWDRNSWIPGAKNVYRAVRSYFRYLATPW